ncbi:MAG: hypothetical protein ACXWM1_09305 [Candidatus Binataceae bacterium]
MTTNSERAALERLAVCLARLAAFKPADLAQTDRRRSIFRSGLPHFERTLGLFRQVAHSNLRHLSLDHINLVAEDAEKTLAQLRDILSFTDEGVEDPKRAAAAMISAVRDAYPPIYEKHSPIINAPAGEPQIERRPRRRVALRIGLATVALAGAVIVGGHYAGHPLYPRYTVLADKVLSALR